jgi:hypothetical protein
MKFEISCTMEFITNFLQILFWIFLAVTILGMVKPWWVLWFLDFKNRLTVLRIYGSITLLLGLAVLLTERLL